MEVLGLAAQIQVTGDDELRAERSTRALGRALEAVEGVAVEYRAGSAGAVEGAKGAGAVELLKLAVEWAWPAAAPLVAEKIKDWRRTEEHKEEHAVVRVTVGEQYVELAGDPTEAQERLLVELLRGHAE